VRRIQSHGVMTNSSSKPARRTVASPFAAAVFVCLAGCALSYDDFQVESASGSGASGGTSSGGSSGTGSSGTGSSGTGGSGAAGGDGSGAAGGAPQGGGGGSGGGPPGGGGTGGSASCTTVTYTAVVADCVAVADPNPDDCIAALFANEMIIDTNFSDAGGGQYEVFLRFDLDSAFSADEVSAVTLRMTGSPAGQSDNTGDIHRVTPFDRNALFSTGTLPTNVAAAAIAGSQGALAANEVIDWALPTTLAQPGQSVFLRANPQSSDGARYMNSGGANPPLLIVTCQ